MIDIVPIVLVALTLFLFWGLYCNQRTHNDMMMVLDRAHELNLIEGDPDRAMVLLQGIKCVDYDRHMWHRIFLRDPWSLYSTEVRELLHAEGAETDNTEAR